MNPVILRTLFSGKELSREINRSNVYVSQRLCGHGSWTDNDLYLIDKAVTEKKKILSDGGATNAWENGVIIHSCPNGEIWRYLPRKEGAN